ncbi:MAG: bifunctional glutamate N-acetyltransferase/amino-acid acetyltransferase ArgJ [Desulfobacterota bacterium]|nr:bifunctional glutamate N-acetyltransferase/amino-acid acetyltransferase ArgJ [Thermodesulfobacteriota bacterium]
MNPNELRFKTPESPYQVQGFQFSGVSAGIKKDGKRDLGLIYSEVPAHVAGLFTTNRVKAAPVLIDMERIRGGTCQAVLINSGNANACTGERGIRDAKRISSLLARRMKLDEERVLLASTGVIGAPLPVKRVEGAMPELIKGLSPEGWNDLVEAIMTTDTRPKMAWAACRIGGKEVRLCGMAKGAGMICPNLATMLSFLVTDAHIQPPLLQKMLREAAEISFNRITIDGETSTNDTVLLLANGKAGHPILHRMDRQAEGFQRALVEVCRNLAESIVRDGEGVTKVIEIVIRGARTRNDARKAAYAIAHSPLVKTAFFGEDANWGRILCALGHCGIPLHPDRIDVFFDKAPIVRNGKGLSPRSEARAAEVIKRPSFGVTVDLHQGSSSFSLLTTDLSLDYVKVNASYRS